jgi:dTDP-4-dehydrorhamnose 3,5-epimerase
MKVEKTELPGVLLIDLDAFGDARGYFCETWQQRRYEEIGVRGPFVQDNISLSARGVLRGLHFQHPNPQGKLVHVLQGEIFDVAVDIRVGSPAFGRWVGAVLSSENRRQMFVPEGFAHGFCALSESALIADKCTALDSQRSEGSLLWNDPEVGVRWPVERPSLSPKDEAAPSLEQLAAENRLPKYLSS